MRRWIAACAAKSGRAKSAAGGMLPGGKVWQAVSKQGNETGGEFWGGAASHNRDIFPKPDRPRYPPTPCLHALAPAVVIWTVKMKGCNDA